MHSSESTSAKEVETKTRSSNIENTIPKRKAIKPTYLCQIVLTRKLGHDPSTTKTRKIVLLWSMMWSNVHRNQNKKHLLIFDLADKNQFLLRLFWEFNFRYYTNAMIDYLVELLQGSPGFDKKILNACFCWPIQQQRNYLISKWN